MPRGSRSDVRDRAGRGPRRELKLRILILCEGEVTEPGYFRDLLIEFRNPLVEIEIQGYGVSPKTLVERAAARKKESDRQARHLRDASHAFDEIWCVFDVDEHARLTEARRQARDNGIELAVFQSLF